MITLLCTGAHSYTHRLLERDPGFAFRWMGYNRALRSPLLARSTYIFGDLDRLGFWELELAAVLYRDLKAAGLRVLNDPARVLQRFALLRQLKDAGLNRFDVWRADDGRMPDRYPVFLRTQSAHRGPLSDLLADEAKARAALTAALDQGHPLKDLMFAEYCAEANENGVFRKLAEFKVGERTIPTLSVHERQWAAKFGERGVAGAELYADELEIMRSDRFGPAAAKAFKVAGIDYGRADFALVGGHPQFYEINTNPTIELQGDHPFTDRLKSEQVFLKGLREAFAEIDTPAGGRAIRLSDRRLIAQRRRDRFHVRARWTV